jgi:thiosulfate/3-mercaptopyruvate sulfurtransferase
MTVNLQDTSHPGSRTIVTARELAALSETGNVRIVDLRPDKECVDGTIPGAIRLDYAKLVRKLGKAEGMLPTHAELEILVDELGILPDHRIVAYDSSSGIRATRLLWTLAVIGYPDYALLDGGFGAWNSAGLAVTDSPATVEPVSHPVESNPSEIANLDYVLESLGQADRCIVDVRSAGEYAGSDVRAERGGHIPGAVHYEWLNVLDRDRGSALRGAEIIRRELTGLGITPEKEIIPYCQSNRRSAHAFVVLKWLGYPRVRAYEGSWSEWGNAKSVPVEV